jgi:hypothetical protein
MSTGKEDSLASRSSDQTDRNRVILPNQTDSRIISRLTDGDGNIHTATKRGNLRVGDSAACQHRSLGCVMASESDSLVEWVNEGRESGSTVVERGFAVRLEPQLVTPSRIVTIQGNTHGKPTCPNIVYETATSALGPYHILSHHVSRPRHSHGITAGLLVVVEEIVVEPISVTSNDWHSSIITFLGPIRSPVLEVDSSSRVKRWESAFVGFGEFGEEVSSDLVVLPLDDQYLASRGGCLWHADR